MASLIPFRQSSFFFGRRGSYGAHAASPADCSDGEGCDSPGAGLRAALLAGAEVDVESCHNDGFVFSWKRLVLHVGPGALMCIAFVDPGNLEADLQTGANTGYQLLWVLLWATCMGGLLQSLAARLGVATGKHLAEHCRQQYPPGVRHVLWAMAELAIIGSDIQEVIGTAIALLLLSGGRVPLWGGVLVAAGAAYALLFLERLGSRWLEVAFELMVAVMSVAMGWLFFVVDIPYGEVARGLAVPSLTRAGVPTACGLLGAIIMPHNLFLHSALVHSRPVDAPGGDARPAQRSAAAKKESILYYGIEAGAALAATLFINVCVVSVFARGFFGRPGKEDIGLANAGAYLGAAFGPHMAAVWAVGLLAAGQSSTMTGTYAGQFVMGGFLDLKMSAARRTLLTRAIAICPTLAVALSARADSTRLDALNQGINILQSVQLPFAVIPLLLLTSDRAVMGQDFVNGRATSAACWLVAAAIIAINTSTAYETLAPLLAGAWPLHLAFAAAVSAYVGFLAYLVATPEGAARAAAALSRSVSRWSLRRSSAPPSSHASAASLLGGGPPGEGGEEGGERPGAAAPPPPFDQPAGWPVRQAQQAQQEQKTAGEARGTSSLPGGGA